jgi:plastocyanin
MGSRRIFILIVFILIAVLIAGCQSQLTQATDSVPGIAVDISSDQCPNIEVKSGEQVTWKNTDNEVHVLRHRPEQGDVQFVAGDLQPGDSFSFLFIDPGTYHYECSEGTGIYGTVIVSP